MKKKKYKRFKKLSRKQKIFLILLAGFILICMYLFYDIPSPFNLNSDQISVSTKLMDRNGKLFYEIYTDERRTPIELTDLPPYVIEATLAIE
ncbi:MAG: hypothetical protein ACD_57C00309G0003, partial [uncultured bacterium]